MRETSFTKTGTHICSLQTSPSVCNLGWVVSLYVEQNSVGIDAVVSGVTLPQCEPPRSSQVAVELAVKSESSKTRFLTLRSSEYRADGCVVDSQRHDFILAFYVWWLWVLVKPMSSFKHIHMRSLVIGPTKPEVHKTQCRHNRRTCHRPYA